MSDLAVSRLIHTHTDSSRIEDGTELRTPQSLPASWKDGDMVSVELPSNERITLVAEPDDGPNVFSYKPDNYSTWHIRLERLPADGRGHIGLRVKFEEHHKYLQQSSDERE